MRPGGPPAALNRARRELGLPEEPRPATAEPTVARERAITPPSGIAIPSAIKPELLRTKSDKDGDE